MFRKTILAALALAPLTLAQAVAPALAQSDEERQQIEAVVRDYLIENPEVIEQALVALQEKRQQAQQAEQSKLVGDLEEQIFNSENQAVIGNPEGDVTLVEFFDYNCGYCRQAIGDTMALIEANPDLRVVLKEFPILSQGSVEAARVSVAVKNLAPDSYSEFHQRLLESSGSADRAKALALAGDLGLDVAAIEAEAGRDETLTDIREAHDLATALGISGTPSYVIGGEVIPGAAGYDTLAQKIESVESCGAATC